MMKLAEAVGVASGRPSGSKMCIHPVSENTPEIGTKTMEISASRQKYVNRLVATTDADNGSKGGGIRRIHDDLSRWASVAWHSDVSFENVPADYSMLKINVLPESGGDTMWASTSDVSTAKSPVGRSLTLGRC
jgi:alpha-ketoglutarate-dependent taurine dioxygenase